MKRVGVEKFHSRFWFSTCIRCSIHVEGNKRNLFNKDLHIKQSQESLHQGLPCHRHWIRSRALTNRFYFIWKDMLKVILYYPRLPDPGPKLSGSGSNFQEKPGSLLFELFNQCSDPIFSWRSDPVFSWKSDPVFSWRSDPDRGKVHPDIKNKVFQLW